jgi:folate-dependent phosphoribosylglycinamide formyltransferase PurN
VLICHGNDPIDCEGIASWLAKGFVLAGIVVLQDKPGALLRKLRQEYRRVGALRMLDVILFRLVYKWRHARADAKWVQDKVRELQQRYAADLAAVPRLVANDPNTDAVHDFIAGLQPQFALARCKHILQKKIFGIPRFGTYALHPGICPLYRNAHGCFWALVNRDLAHVGMTLLKVDSGIDTGPVYLQSSYPYDETIESHIVIQHRVVLENLDAIATVLYGISTCTVLPKTIALRRSFNWGQPWFTAYVHWQRLARRVAA